MECWRKLLITGALLLLIIASMEVLFYYDLIPSHKSNT